MRYEGGDICIFSVRRCTTYKDEPGVVGGTFDGGWSTRWWQNMGGWAENDGWAVGVVDCRVSDEEDRAVGQVISLVGLVGDIWSEFVLSGDEYIWGEGGDAGNIWSCDEVVGELSKIFWYFALKDVFVADSDWDEDDWERKGRNWTEGRFDLIKEDWGDDWINDDCDKHDDDNCDEACGALSAGAVPVSNVFTVAVIFCKLCKQERYSDWNHTAKYFCIFIVHEDRKCVWHGGREEKVDASFIILCITWRVVYILKWEWNQEWMVKFRKEVVMKAGVITSY